MFIYLLLLAACGPNTTRDSTEERYVEGGYRLEDGETEPWIRSAEVWCEDEWWHMRVSVAGIASSAEWIMDLGGAGEPHRMVADGYVPEVRLQDFTNESPYSPTKKRAVETLIPCEVGLSHMIWVQGNGAYAAECVVFGPKAAEAVYDGPLDGCTLLSYYDSHLTR